MTILLRFMLTALLALPLAFSQGAQAQEYRIQSGDRLAIEVLEDASLNRTVTVLPGGTIDFPYAGSIRVAGQSPTAVGSAISQSLAGVLASPADGLRDRHAPDRADPAHRPCRGGGGQHLYHGRGERAGG